MQSEKMLQAGVSVTGRPHHRWVDWITQHQVALFFAFTFIFSWTIYALLALIPIENNTTLSRLILVAAYGPALSAFLLSSLTTTMPRARTPTRRWLLFFPLLAIVAGVEWLDHVWWGHPIDLSLLLADAILVLLATYTLTRILLDRPEGQRRFTGAASWPGWGWVLVALGLWPLLVLTGNLIARRVGVTVPPAPVWPDVALPLILLESFAWVLLFGGPLNEEPGWRGFALPRLQSSFSPLVASIVIGAMWGLWHVPLHLMGVYYGGAWGAVIRLQEIPRAILFTWLYNRTKGSLLVVILFHAATNTVSLFMPRAFVITFILLFLAAAVVVVTDKMWRKVR